MAVDTPGPPAGQSPAEHPEAAGQGTADPAGADQPPVAVETPPAAAAGAAPAVAVEAPPAPPPPAAAAGAPPAAAVAASLQLAGHPSGPRTTRR